MQQLMDNISLMLSRLATPAGKRVIFLLIELVFEIKSFEILGHPKAQNGVTRKQHIKRFLRICLQKQPLRPLCYHSGDIFGWPFTGFHSQKAQSIFKFR